MEHCQWCGKEFKLKDISYKIKSPASIEHICDTCYDRLIRKCVVKMFIDDPEGFKIDMPLEISEIKKPNQLNFYKYLMQKDYKVADAQIYIKL